MTPCLAMLPVVSAVVAAIEFTVGTPDARVFALLAVGALLNAMVRAALARQRRHAKEVTR